MVLAFTGAAQRAKPIGYSEYFLLISNQTKFAESRKQISKGAVLYSRKALLRMGSHLLLLSARADDVGKCAEVFQFPPQHECR